MVPQLMLFPLLAMVRTTRTFQFLGACLDFILNPFFGVTGSIHWTRFDDQKCLPVACQASYCIQVGEYWYVSQRDMALTLQIEQVTVIHR